MTLKNSSSEYDTTILQPTLDLWVLSFFLFLNPETSNSIDQDLIKAIIGSGKELVRTISLPTSIFHLAMQLATVLLALLMQLFSLLMSS